MTNRTLTNAKLENIACRLLRGRLVDADLLARSQRGTDTLMGAPFIGPHCPTVTVTVVVGSRPKLYREVELNAATGAVLAIHHAGRSFA